MEKKKNNRPGLNSKSYELPLNKEWFNNIHDNNKNKEIIWKEGKKEEKHGMVKCVRCNKEYEITKKGVLMFLVIDEGLICQDCEKKEKK